MARIGTGATASWLGGRTILNVGCLIGTVLISKPAWSQNTYTVTTGGDDSAPATCSGSGTAFTCTTLRDAISASNKAGGSNIINFASNVSTVTLTGNLTPINSSASVATTIDGSTSDNGSVNVNGNGHAVFFVGTAQAVFNDLTVSGAVGARTGLFASKGATVSTFDVNFNNETAIGATGGTGSANSGGATPPSAGGGNAGGVTVASGTLSVSADNNLGPSTNTLTLDPGTTLALTSGFTFDHPITLNGDPTFDVPPGQTTTISSVIADGISPGDVVKTDAGTLILTGANTYTGPTTIDGGTLAIGPGGSIATSSGVNLAAANTAFDISSGGNQTIQDLTGVAGSAVTLGANTLTLGTANSTTFAGVISGAGGALIKDGTGTLTLLGANTYSGGTLVAAGTLLGNATSLQGLIIDNAEVEFNQTTLGTYSGSLYGGGTLVVEGLGGLILTGNSSFFAGNTVVNDGGLIIGPASNPDASLGGSVTVENKGLVQGHGTIGGSLTNISGFVVPVTTSSHTLTVDGAYTQGPAGTLGIGLSPQGSTRLVVGGVAGLAGTLDIASVPGGGYVPFSRFTILTSGGGVSGSFSQVIGTFPALPLTVEYLPNAVDLTLGGFTGATSNETAVANVLNAAFPTATGDFENVLDTAINLPPAQMQQSLSSFGGQIYGNLAEVSLQDRRLFLGAMDERLRLFSGYGSPAAAVLGSLGGGVANVWGSGPNAVQIAALGNAINDGGSPANAPPGNVINDPVGLAIQSPEGAPATNPVGPEIQAPVGNVINDPIGLAASQAAVQQTAAVSPVKPNNLWARGFGQFGDFGSNNGALGSTYSTGGGALGVDLINTKEHLLGVAVGGGQSSVSLNTNPENGTISFVQVGAYGAQALGYGFAVDTAAIYSHDYYDVTRGLVLPGMSRIATSSHDGNDEVVDIGISRPYLASGWQVTPRVGVSYYHIGQSAFSESGADSLDLAVQPNDFNALFSRLGITIADPLVFEQFGVLPEIRVAWLHNFLDADSHYNASFIGTGAASFSQVGPAVGRNAGDFGIGLSFAITQSMLPALMSGFVQYDVSVAPHEIANAVAAGLRVKW